MVRMREISLDSVVDSGLRGLAEEVRGGTWTGRREREVVSYFAFRYLVPACKAGTFLHEPTQIAVEVAVPQLDQRIVRRLTKRATAKTQVCKDLVIWPRPGMTCWDSAGKPTVYPAAILEWKFGGRTLFEYDMQWLREYSKVLDDFVGYAIQVDPKQRDFTVAAARAEGGVLDEDWLRD